MTFQHCSGDTFLSLIGQHTVLRKVAGGINGGEWAGSCPSCGGRDRFRAQPDAAGGGRWWCRQCRESDGWARDVDFVLWRDYGFVPSRDHPEWRVMFRSACDRLGIAQDATNPPAAAPDPTPPACCEAPSAAWQVAAFGFVSYAVDRLWQCPAALDGLHRRGLTDQTISAAAIGYNPRPLYRPAAKWGLERDKDVWLAAGYVFPWFVGSELWKLNIRQAQPTTPDMKYVNVPGGSNAAYSIDTVRAGRPVVLVEGVVDALAMLQAAGQFSNGESVCGVAAVGTTGARAFPWIVRFALARPVLVALDDDEPGDQASRYWLDILKAERLRPTRHDPAEMLEHGDDVAQWLVNGISQRTHTGGINEQRAS